MKAIKEYRRAQPPKPKRPVALILVPVTDKGSSF
jgi:hypothetical protein